MRGTKTKAGPREGRVKEGGAGKLEGEDGVRRGEWGMEAEWVSSEEDSRRLKAEEALVWMGEGEAGD